MKNRTKRVRRQLTKSNLKTCQAKSCKARKYASVYGGRRLKPSPFLFQ